MKKQSLLFCFLAFYLLFLQHGNAQVIRYNYDSDGTIKLNHSWKFHDGDNSQWSGYNFDDSKWDTLNTEMFIDKMPEGKFTGIGWFRISFSLDSEHTAENPIGLLIDQHGASEIYVDGNKIATFGKIGTEANNEICNDPGGIPVPLNLVPGRVHVIAIRYSNHEMDYGFTDEGFKQGGFSVTLIQANNYYSELINTRENIFFIVMMLFGFFIALGISHLLIFFFYRAYKSNLYYFIFIFFLSYFPMGIALQYLTTGIHANTLIQLFTVINFPLFFTSFLAFLYSIFYEKFQKQLWIFMAVAGIAVAGIFVSVWIAALLIFLVVVGTSVEGIRVIIVANRKKKSGARIIGLGGLFLALFVISMLLLVMINGGLYLKGSEGRLFIILLVLSIICLPLCMSVHLAREFAQTNRSLSKKLKEVEVLSEKTIEQEKEKQKLLETEKERLEIQVKERTSEISEQKKIIEEKNKDITDSILYAKKIQDAMLPASDVINELFPENFILFKPKDIVSGDFYWVAEIAPPNSPQGEGKGGAIFIAAADCTGHGVPGALMSMTGNNFLNQIVIERNISSPSSILNELNSAIRKSLKQERSDTESKDGMDIALCRFLPDFSELIYAGANRPLWLIRNNELTEFKADKQAIGGRPSEIPVLFEEQKIPLQKKDCIYIFSDGFADQFGGPQGKKFMTKRLKELLISINSLPMTEQKLKLEDAMNKWRGEITQVDDLLIIGVKI